MALFKADTEEELQKIEALGVPEMNQAINAYHSVTASPEFRELERLRAKALHDEAQALFYAERKGIFTVARNLLSAGDSIEKVAAVTGLTRAEIEGLRDAN